MTKIRVIQKERPIPIKWIKSLKKLFKKLSKERISTIEANEKQKEFEDRRTRLASEQRRIYRTQKKLLKTKTYNNYR